MGPGLLRRRGRAGRVDRARDALIIRNIGGQRVGAQLEERLRPARSGHAASASPNGRSGRRGRRSPSGAASRPATNAVTVHGCTGTIDIADIVADNGADLLEIIGKSLAFVGTNAFIGAHHGAEVMVAIAPPWAELIAATYPDIADVQAQLLRPRQAADQRGGPTAHRRQRRGERPRRRRRVRAPRRVARARARDRQRRPRQPPRARAALLRTDASGDAYLPAHDDRHHASSARRIRTAG